MERNSSSSEFHSPDTDDVSSGSLDCNSPEQIIDLEGTSVIALPEHLALTHPMPEGDVPKQRALQLLSALRPAVPERITPIAETSQERRLGLGPKPSSSAVKPGFLASLLENIPKTEDTASQLTAPEYPWHISALMDSDSGTLDSFPGPTLQQPESDVNVLAPDQRHNVTDWNFVENESKKFAFFMQKLLKGVEHVHFHPVHEFCTCADIYEILCMSYNPPSTKVVKRIVNNDITIKVNVQFYELDRIFVRLEEDKITVEATRGTDRDSYEYHYIFKVFSLPRSLKRENLTARIVRGELILQTGPDLLQAEDIEDAPVTSSPGVSNEKPHEPKSLEFTKFVSQDEFKLKLDVKHFNVDDITVNLIEDKIVIEAKRETHQDYEYHYLHQTVSIPVGLQEYSLSAKLQNGTLAIEGFFKKSPRVARLSKIPWITSGERTFLQDDRFIRVPVEGWDGQPFSPEEGKFEATLEEDEFFISFDVTKLEINEIYVRPKGKILAIEAEHKVKSPFEYLSYYKYLELPTEVENYDVHVYVECRRLYIKGALKSDHNLL